MYQSSPVAVDCHKLDFCLEYDAYTLSIQKYLIESAMI